MHRTERETAQAYWCWVQSHFIKTVHFVALTWIKWIQCYNLLTFVHVHGITSVRDSLFRFYAFLSFSLSQILSRSLALLFRPHWMCGVHIRFDRIQYKRSLFMTIKSFAYIHNLFFILTARYLRNIQYALFVVSVTLSQQPEQFTAWTIRVGYLMLNGHGHGHGHIPLDAQTRYSPSAFPLINKKEINTKASTINVMNIFYFFLHWLIDWILLMGICTVHTEPYTTNQLAKYADKISLKTPWICPTRSARNEIAESNKIQRHSRRTHRSNLFPHSAFVRIWWVIFTMIFGRRSFERIFAIWFSTAAKRSLTEF